MSIPASLLIWTEKECSHTLQAKEWLVKIDNSHSVPYLLVSLGFSLTKNKESRRFVEVWLL